MVLCSRFRINFLKRLQRRWELTSEKRENMPWVCSSSPRMNFAEIRRKKCLRPLWIKKDLSFWRGEKCRLHRIYWEKRRLNACLISCNVLSKSRSRLKKDWNLIVSFILHEEYLNSPTRIPMWYLFPAERLYTKECFWFPSFVCSLMICRTWIMNQPLPWYIPALVPIHSQAGNVLIQTALSCTMVKSIPFVVMQTKCLPVKRPWNPTI